MSEDAGRLVQAFLGVGVVALIGLIAWQLWGRRTAEVAMAVGAVCPPLIALGAVLISEPLFLLFELGAIAAVIEHRRSGRPYAWASTAGALIGLAALTRTNGVFLAPPLALALWTATPRLTRHALAAPAALVAAAVLVVSPWMARNALVFDSFVPLTTQGGIFLARNYNDAARTDPDLPSVPSDIPEFVPLTRNLDLDESEVERKLREMALEYMREHPSYVATTIGRNAIRTLNLDQDLTRLTLDLAGIEDPWLAEPAIYGFYVVALLALAGAFVPAARRMPWFVWAAPVLAFLPALLMAAGRTRYRAPIDPLLVLLASIALVATWDRLRARPGPSADEPGEPRGAPTSTTPTRSSPAASRRRPARPG